MTNGSSQGLFVIVAVVIFGIFVVISYLLFRDKLQTSLASIFQDGVSETMPIDSFFKNTITNKEYVSDYKDGSKEFLNSKDWDLAPLGDYFTPNQVYTLTFELKTKVAGNISVYNQNGSSSRYQMNPNKTVISTTTDYEKYAITFKLEKTNESVKTALLAFYGTYGTGVEPTVKNVKVEKGNTTKSLSSEYNIYDNYK